jgi:mannose-6-phosphate isomerase-like protein (cupin superfamily)
MLEAGDTVAIPPNVVHQILNDSKADLTFLAVCAPPWTPDCSVFVD